MHLIWFLTSRDLRRRWQQLLPFCLMTAGLVFPLTALVIFLHSGPGETGKSINTAMIGLPRYGGAVLGFVAAWAFFSSYSAVTREEDRLLCAMGQRRRYVTLRRMLIGGICLGCGMFFGLSLAIPGMACVITLMRQIGFADTRFVPMTFRLHIGDTAAITATMAAAMFLGIFAGRASRPRSSPINARGLLPANGSLRQYGRRIRRRTWPHLLIRNGISAVLWIVPMIFFLSSFYFAPSTATHDWTIDTPFDWESEVRPSRIPVEYTEILARLPGVERTEGLLPVEKKEGITYDRIYIWITESADEKIIQDALTTMADELNLEVHHTRQERARNNQIARLYQGLFSCFGLCTMGGTLLTLSALIRANLENRREEFALLCALGAKRRAMISLNQTESLWSYAPGMLLSLSLGALCTGIMVVEGGNAVETDIFLWVPLLLIPLALTVIGHITRCTTIQILQTTHLRTGGVEGERL